MAKRYRLRHGATRISPVSPLHRIAKTTASYVSTPGAPAQTKAAFVLEDGQPGLQPA
jgi:hypothetical protein